MILILHNKLSSLTVIDEIDFQTKFITFDQRIREDQANYNLKVLGGGVEDKSFIAIFFIYWDKCFPLDIAIIGEGFMAEKFLCLNT